MKSIIIRNSDNIVILKIKKTKVGYDIEKLKHLEVISSTMSKLYITIVDKDNHRTNYKI